MGVSELVTTQPPSSPHVPVAAMATNKAMLALELNGATISAGVVSVHTGGLVGPLSVLPSPAEDSAEEIVGCMVELLRLQHEQARDAHHEVLGVGIAVPGPFDYDKGLSLRTSGKLSSLRGVDLRTTLEHELGVPVTFCNNAVSFAMGAWRVGYPQVNRFVGVILTTGGSAAFLDRGRVAEPRSGAPLAGGVDVFSVTRHTEAAVRTWAPSRAMAWFHPKVALEEGYLARTGRARPMAFLARAARNGDTVAQELYEELGACWGEVLATLTQAFAPEIIAFGGLVSANAFELFGPRAQEVYLSHSVEPATLVQASSMNVGLVGAAQYGFLSLAGV